jgi:MerR family transcriptional regulator, mercuric resistance operon regulatory protein
MPRQMQVQLFTIGQLSKKCRVTPRAIRYYENRGLFRAPMRSDSNYRLFDSETVHRVRFISKCRSLGFSIDEISDILTVSDDPDHTCAQIEGLTKQHLDLIDEKLHDLMEMRVSLAEYSARCTGKDVPDCAVLDFLKKN